MMSQLEMRGLRVVGSMRFMMVGLTAKTLSESKLAPVIFKDPQEDRKNKVKRRRPLSITIASAAKICLSCCG